MSQAADQIPATPLDLVSAIMDLPKQRLDFLIDFEFEDEPPEIEALKRGAQSATLKFPMSARVLVDKHWIPKPNWEPLVALRPGTYPAEVIETRAFSHETPSLRQVFIPSSAQSPAHLTVHGHHAGADLMSVLNWVSHQLKVAHGTSTAVTQSKAIETVNLKKHPSPRRKSYFSYVGPSRGLWTPTTTTNGTRNFTFVEIDALSFKKILPQDRSFSYNDLLTLAVLETFKAWNADHGRTNQKMSVWMPMNIRQDPFKGFGNGSSRIRVYDRFNSGMTVQEKCELLREQVKWSKDHGEWNVPDLSSLMKLPRKRLAKVLRLYFNRPWVDMCSGPFSHAGKVSDETDKNFLPGIKKLSVYGVLDRRHPLGLFGTTFRGLTRLSITYDSGRMSPKDADTFKAIFEAQLETIRKAITQ